VFHQVTITVRFIANKTLILNDRNFLILLYKACCTHCLLSLCYFVTFIHYLPVNVMLGIYRTQMHCWQDTWSARPLYYSKQRNVKSRS